ncbi:MAG: MFS transporter [Deltaproteobacteria bacterium]|nr:MFS transporter [Deltaproteobacteria bacterium]
MSDERSRLLTRRALRISVAEGLLHAVMVGACESYLGAFAVELGHRGTALAVLATVPILAGALFQLFTGPLVRWLGTRKRVAVFGAALQAAVVGTFVLIALTRDDRLVSLLAAKVLFWIAGAIVAPVWGAWMASLIRGRRRERYFALRSGAAQVGLLVAFLLAGVSIHARADAADPLRPFVALFVVATIARAFSALALLLQPDPRKVAAPPAASGPRLLEVIRGSQWTTAIYLTFLMTGANIAVPFFTPYMLQTLQLDYARFASIIAISLVVKAVFFPFCHRLASRLGLRAMLGIGGTGVAAVALLWASSPSLAVVALAQVLGGVSWSALEYSSYQLLLRSAPHPVRVEFLSIAGSLVGVGTVAGSLVGGLLLDRLGLDYRDLFILSGLCRVLALAPLFGLPRRLFPGELQHLLWRLVSVRPVGGGVQRPILRDEDREEDE